MSLYHSPPPLSEVWKSGVRVDDQLLPTLEELCLERFGATRKATPLPNRQLFKQLKKMSHELKAPAPAGVATHVCLDCG
jgi:hypothetical protein